VKVVGAREPHVAETVVAEGREPTAPETHHLATCPTCFADVRRGRAFDRQLVAAAVALPSPSLPPEVLTVPVPSIRRPPSPSLTSLGVIAALVAAAGLVGWSVLPRAGAGASAAPTVAPDPHVVVVGDTIWRISLTGRTVEVSQTTGGPLPGGSAIPIASWDLGEFVNGGWSTFVRCPRTDGRDQWLFVGHQAEDTTGFTYSGPPASGAFAQDGLYLWVLDPSNPGKEPVVAKRADGSLVAGASHGLNAAFATVRQRSGCLSYD
jgi:hypothetical protein